MAFCNALKFHEQILPHGRPGLKVRKTAMLRHLLKQKIAENRPSGISYFFAIHPVTGTVGLWSSVRPAVRGKRDMPSLSWNHILNSETVLHHFAIQHLIGTACLFLCNRQQQPLVTDMSSESPLERRSRITAALSAACSLRSPDVGPGPD